MSEKKEERSEYISMYVSPSVKKKFDLAKDNKSLQDTIISNYFSGEKEWMEQELAEMDEVTIRYRAKLIEYKNNFEKTQDLYVAEIEGIVGQADKAFKKFDLLTKKLDDRVENTYQATRALSEKVSYINVAPLERILTAIEKYESLTETQKEVIEFFMQK